jgi:lipopolysaccharide biosynthesis glycosyltransferase
VDLSPIRIFLGFDQREAVAYHTMCQSIIDRTTAPVAITPLASSMFEEIAPESDGTNAFTLTRFLVPYLCNYSGWAIFADSDMLVREDLKELWDMRGKYVFDKGAAVVKHAYKTKAPLKYVGTEMEAGNEDYPRKNWSSLILWYCGHAANRVLTPEFIREKGGKYLHRFQWLSDEQIGTIPQDWNHLVGEYPTQRASNFHYTLGVPAFKHYSTGHEALHWHYTFLNALECGGEKPEHIVNRAKRLTHCAVR